MGDDVLRCFCSVGELNIRQLMDVYAPSAPDGAYTGLRQLKGDQDFLDDLYAFFRCVDAKLYVWQQGEKYCSALRIEPYLDGYLVSCLGTSPDQRRAGYGSSLLSSAIKMVHKPVYVHIEKHNRASISLHMKCGFVKILDHAVYVDGSVYQSSCTMRYDL